MYDFCVGLRMRRYSSRFTNESFLLLMLFSNGKVIDATGSCVMLDKSDGRYFFTELFKHDNTFEERPVFRIVEVLILLNKTKEDLTALPVPCR